ncbi:MAG: hypothetical protein WC459_04450 [Patescibacteria group bacterium]
MKKYLPIIILAIAAIAAAIGLSFLAKRLASKRTLAPGVSSSYSYEDNFNRNDYLEEASSMSKSKSSFWWLSSGAVFITENGIGSTNIGRLASGSKWQVDYANNNSDGTDGGFLPQNIFRLVTSAKLKNFEQQCYFYIVNYNAVASQNRNESNGIFFFNRYQDQDNVYYTGIRVDGAAVIKKKIKGEYYTMAYIPNIFSGAYNRSKTPNLLPIKKWIGMKSEIKDNPDGTVDIKLFIDAENNGIWRQVAKATDDGKSFNGAAILASGHGGIRTDFMDIEFSKYIFNKIN